MTNECAICEKWPFDLQPGSMRAGADLRLRDCLKGSRSTFRTSRGERISSGATVDPTAASSGSTPPPTHTHGPMARAEHAQSICSEAVSFKDHPGRCLAFNRQSGHSPPRPVLGRIQLRAGPRPVAPFLLRDGEEHP